MGLWAAGLAGVAGLVSIARAASASDPGTAYAVMAPLQQYRMPAPAEIALARSAAPASISADAGIMILGDHGYRRATEGSNGFVCLVERSWAAAFDQPEFWNPKLRSPICFNPIAVRSVMPDYLERTRWVLAGVPKADMIARTGAAVAANTFPLPEPGAMAFMMSRQGFVSDADGHWHPHLMIFVAHGAATDWGANLHGSPVFAVQGHPDPVTTFFVPVPHWSDGTQAVVERHP